MNETTIWKYEIPIDEYPEIDMPKNAEILSFNAQHDSPCLWARVTPGSPTEKRKFRLAGTGHPLDENVGKYIGTVILEGLEGSYLVFHLFELK